MKNTLPIVIAIAFWVALMALLVAFPINAFGAGPKLTAGTLRLNSNTSPACASGETCLWANGNSLNWRMSGGTDFVLTAPQLPSQGGHAGQYLGTDGSSASWSVVPLPSLVTNSVSGLVPHLAGVSGAVPVDSGSNSVVYRKLTADDVGPGFAISSFTSSTFGVTVEIGTSIASPSFTVAYANAVPNSAQLTDTDSNTPVSLISPFTSGTMPYTYMKIVPNQSSTVTVTAIGPATKTASLSITWLGRVFYGVATPGTINQAFVLALPSNGLQSGFANTYAVGAGGNTKKFYLFFDAAFGTPTIFKDAGTGFGVPTSCPYSVAVTSNGVTRTLTGCVSDNFLNASYSEQVQ